MKQGSLDNNVDHFYPYELQYTTDTYNKIKKDCEAVSFIQKVRITYVFRLMNGYPMSAEDVYKLN